jgi:hypothetical protein
MGPAKWLVRLKKKYDAGTISEKEFIRYVQLAGSRADEATAREMYRTSYADQQRVKRGVQGIVN